LGAGGGAGAALGAGGGGGVALGAAAAEAACWTVCMHSVELLPLEEMSDPVSSNSKSSAVEVSWTPSIWF
jgi:hypothetical protein